VDALLLRGRASWDLLGVHWQSYSSEGSYYEQGVAGAVKEHNVKVGTIRR
jgi:hypothetical protein